MNAIYTKDFLICPWCDGESECQVSHLYGDRDFRGGFGPWACKVCNGWIEGKITGKRDVTVWKSSLWRPNTDGVALLKFDGKEGPVFFILECSRYHGNEVPKSIEAQQESDRYGFEEHSCPTNWLRDVVEVVRDGEIDPHGFLTFVRSVDMPEGDDDPDWATIFPEAFGPVEIEGSATEVREPLALTNGAEPTKA